MSNYRVFNKTFTNTTITTIFDLSNGLDLSCQDIIDVSNIYFCNTTALLSDDSKFGGRFYPGLPTANYNVITCSGQLDMSCNNILDVSRIYFCGRLGSGRNWIGQGTSFDVSCEENIKIITAADASMGFYQGATLEMRIDSKHIAVGSAPITNPVINFGLAGDSNTGISQSIDTHVEFITDGAFKTVMVSNALGMYVGSETIPAINFIDNTSTGMWRSATNIINFSTDGTERMEINNDAVTIGKPGSTEDQIMALIRNGLSASETWEDGNYGNSEYIYFTPTDFVKEKATTDNIGIKSQASASTTRTMPFAVTTDSAILGAVNLVAIKLIPKGYRINPAAGFTASLYSRASINLNKWYVYEQTIRGASPTPSLEAAKTLLGSSTDQLTADGISNISGHDWVGTSTSISTGDLCCVIFIDFRQRMSMFTGVTGARVPIKRV